MARKSNPRRANANANRQPAPYSPNLTPSWAQSHALSQAQYPPLTNTGRGTGSNDAFDMGHARHTALILRTYHR